MDEAVFLKALSAFRVVRKSTAVLPRVRRRRRFASTPAPALAAPCSAPTAAAPPPPSAPDFWPTLDALLRARLAPAPAKAAAAAFDALHYQSVRTLSLEDIEDLTRMLARELGVAMPGGKAMAPSIDDQPALVGT